MIQVSAPNRMKTFTSGQGFDSTFDMDIKGNIDQYETLKIDAELEDFDEDYEDITDVLNMESVSRADPVPSKVFLPTTTSRVRVGFQVWRGPLHPREIQKFTVNVIVYGKTEEGEEEYIGEDSLVLRG